MSKGPQLYFTQSSPTATSDPTTPVSAQSISSGPVTAAPSSYRFSNFSSAGTYTIPGTGSDDNTTTIHLTSFKYLTRTVPQSGGCTINAPNANLIYWNPVTYSYSRPFACPILPASTDGVVLASVVTTAPYSFPVSLHAASTRFINFTDFHISSVGNYTTTNTYINLGTTETFSGSAFTSTNTLPASTVTLTGSGVTTTITQSAKTYTGSGAGFTTTDTISGQTQIGTATVAIYSTSSFAGVTDVLRPDVTYMGATYAYTATSPTPYLFFSVLEIEQSSSTSTVTVPIPFLSAYPGNPAIDWSGNATATGALSPDLVGQLVMFENVNVSNCAVGTFRGQATLDVGISLYFSQVCVAPARALQTVGGLGPITSDAGGVLAAPMAPTTTPDSPSALPPVASPPPAQPSQQQTVPQAPSPAPQPPPQTAPQAPAPVAQPSQQTAPQAPSPAPQSQQQPPAPQGPQPPTTASGLGGLILSGLGATQTPSPGTVPGPVAVPGVPAAPVTVTVGNVPVAISSNNVVINGQTVNPAPGSPPLTTLVGNQPVVINPSQVIAAGTTVAILTPVDIPAVSIAPAQQPPVITIGNSPITANAQSQFVVAGQTLSPGGPAITVGGTAVSLGPSASSIFIGGSTILLQPSAAAPPPIIAGQQIQIAPNGNIVLPGGTTVSAGGPAATISGTSISVLPSGAGVVVGGKTVALPAGVSSSLPIVAGQQIQVASNGNLVLPGGMTISAGGSAATISGTPVSVLPNGAGVVIGTSTIPLPVGAASPLPTVAGQQLQRGPDGSIIIPGVTTLTPGGAAATVSGTIISVASNGASIVIGGSTIPLAPTATPLPSIIFGGSTITANSKTQLVIAGQTLAPGSAITVSGTVISLALGASDVVIGGSTAFLAAPTGRVSGGGNLTSFTGAAGSARTAAKERFRCMAIGMIVILGMFAL